MEYKLPILYSRADPKQRRAVREQYVREQQGLCYWCKQPLTGPAAEHVKNISKAMKNLVETDPIYKQRLLENSKKAADITRGVPKEKIKCPHCNKVGGKPAMKRFHFENCKEKL